MDQSQAVALPSGWSVDTLKESVFALIHDRDQTAALERAHILRLIDERDRLYMTKFEATIHARQEAFTAQDKAVTAAFLASEKAVLKAEQAQKEYNERSNEFRGQLDDQAKTLMARTETLSMFKAVEEKLQAHVSTAHNDLEMAKASTEKQLDMLQAEIVSLRETRSAGGAKDAAADASRSQRNWTIGLIVAIALGVLASLVEVGVVMVFHK
jgi:hypothetical protein